MDAVPPVLPVSVAPRSASTAETLGALFVTWSTGVVSPTVSVAALMTTVTGTPGPARPAESLPVSVTLYVPAVPARAPAGTDAESVLLLSAFPAPSVTSAPAAVSTSVAVGGADELK